MGEDAARRGAEPTFEDAMRELETIVHDLETGETDLEAAIAAYERGVTLKKLCEDKLRQAELRVEKIDGDDGVAARAEPFDGGRG